MGTGSHLGLSFSELGVLMSTPSSEKDSLLRLAVPVKIAPKFLKKEVFIVTPFTYVCHKPPHYLSYSLILGRVITVAL